MLVAWTEISTIYVVDFVIMLFFLSCKDSLLRQLEQYAIYVNESRLSGNQNILFLHWGSFSIWISGELLTTTVSTEMFSFFFMRCTCHFYVRVIYGINFLSWQIYLVIDQNNLSETGELYSYFAYSLPSSVLFPF